MLLPVIILLFWQSYQWAEEYGRFPEKKVEWPSGKRVLPVAFPYQHRTFESS
jgi:hypothetical protein